MIRWATDSERSRFGRVEEQHRELVATEPRGQVVGANAAVDALGDDPQEAVAGPVAQRVVHDLEVVEVEEQDDGIEPGLAGGQLRIHLLGEHRPVRQPGQRVVVGLVAQLLLEAGQLGERLLQLAVLEGNGRLVGERLEEPQVLAVERGPLGEPVGDGHRADQPGLADERADHRLPDGATGQRPAGGRREERPALGGDPAVDARAELHALGDHGLRLAIVDRRRAQGVGALVARVEDHLGDLGPEHRARVIQQCDQRGVQLRRVLQDPARLVEQLELLVLLAFRQVRPVREEDRHERDQQEQDGARVDPHDGHREQREARVRQRHDQPELEHLGQLLELRRPARQRDRGGDRQRTDHDRDEHRREGSQPVDRARRSARTSRCGGTRPGSRPR